MNEKEQAREELRQLMKRAEALKAIRAEKDAEIARLRAKQEDLRAVAKEMAEQVALLPASDGRILGLLPVLCRLRAALADKGE